MKIPDHQEYLQNETITLNDTVYPMLKFEIVPGKYSEVKKLDFNWTLVNFTNVELLIQLNFEHLNYVSSHAANYDSIKLIIYGWPMFADLNGNYMRPPTVLIPKEIPPQSS